MAKVKYDVSNAEVRNFEVPKPGVYEAVIHDMEHGQSNSGNPMFTIVFEITKGDYKSSRVWYYILTDGSQEWRLREFTEALGLKTKGTLDTDALKGTVVQIKTAVDPARDGYDEKAKIKNVLPATSRNGGAADDSGEEEPPYEEWEISDLREEVEARELEITGKKTKKRLVDALNADDEEGGDEEEEEEEGEEDEEGDEEEITHADLKKMDRTKLKELIKEEELEVKVMRKDSEDDLREKIANALELGDEAEDEEEEEEDEEEGDEDTDYESWEISELKAELKERGLKTEGRKSSLVKRLKDDDESDDEPF